MDRREFFKNCGLGIAAVAIKNYFNTKEFYMFSASSFSKLEEGELAPDLTKYINNTYRPLVEEKHWVVGRGLELYQGDKFVHNRLTGKLEDIAEGAVLKFVGEKGKMEQWIKDLCRFEMVDYNMQSKRMRFYKLFKEEKEKAEITAPIFYINDLEELGDKDGKLIKKEGGGEIKTVEFALYKKKFYTYVHVKDGKTRIIVSNKKKFPFEDKKAKYIDVKDKSDNSIKSAIIDTFRDEFFEIR